MTRRVDDLFGQISSFPALHAAALRAVRGKRAKAGAAAFMARPEPECLRLERALLARPFHGRQFKGKRATG